MEEKVLVKSYSPDTSKFLKTVLIIAAILALIIFMGRCSSVSSDVQRYKEVYNAHREAGSCGWSYESYERCWECRYVENNSAFGAGFGAGLTCFVVIMAVALLIKLLLSSFSLVVTDKRIYCKTLWIHHICLPVDSMTVVARVGLFNLLAIGAPAGRIYVSFVKNSKEIYDILNALIIARQEKSLAEIVCPEEAEV